MKIFHNFPGHLGSGGFIWLYDCMTLDLYTGGSFIFYLFPL